MINPAMSSRKNGHTLIRPTAMELAISAPLFKAILHLAENGVRVMYTCFRRFLLMS